jgi:hypothetical protein
MSTGSGFGYLGAWETGSDVAIRFLDPTFVSVVVDIFCLSLSGQNFFEIFVLA